VKELPAKLQDSATTRLPRASNPNGARQFNQLPVATEVQSQIHGMIGDSCPPPLQSFQGGAFMRRDDLLKPDLMSEVILLGFGALIFVILLLILVAAWTQAPALV
jgi:hypothetical protein